MAMLLKTVLPFFLYHAAYIFEQKDQLNERLIIFLKNPQLGQVKTRLAQTVGDAAALAIYFRLLDHTRTITGSIAVEKVVYYSEFIDTEDQWNNKAFRKALQTNGNLGTRMQVAFQDAFASGCSSVVVIGTDCMELTTEIISLAFENLGQCDAVIGPAADGGYYLLGLKKFHGDLFLNKNWSTDTVLQETRADFIRLGLSFRELPMLRDVDTYDDLDEKLKEILTRTMNSTKPK